VVAMKQMLNVQKWGSNASHRYGEDRRSFRIVVNARGVVHILILQVWSSKVRLLPKGLAQSAGAILQRFR
jgi:hypothetical protein